MATRLSHHSSGSRSKRRRKPPQISPHGSSGLTGSTGRIGSPLNGVSQRGREVRRSWRRPTFGEFLDQIEREFGSTPDLGNLPLTGLTRCERLGPGELRDLCSQLGLPPEDFGLDG
jgi:hypothetical protein